jgi:hypothetical protein
VSKLPGVQPASVPGVVWQELTSARPLNEHEARLLGELAAFVDEPHLREQIDTARVGANCTCGCSSVRLQTDAPVVPAERVAQLSSSGRADYFAVHSAGRPRTLRHVDVVLHVGSGRIMELEVFHNRRGHGVQIPLERITGLQALWLS